ncbi:hypothetical protein [Prevotella sp. OH937_COT-195]|uniref:hypothetical protein n=1 Tax=Prevotella sp. OH937_COT-195 TaxID=2491051 RepID=UPI000F64A895|nr:hypothetical protein [Prevotella sp. OH937_COT-195]RRC98431.1 hypothetical protein EII32_09315 [Prevotella sp. OH937_COT-195]
MKESPQPTCNKTETKTVSSYEKMNNEIEKFIEMVDEEERKWNKVLHNKSSSDEQRDSRC